MDERVKVVVIGAGPAGAASGIFLKRAGLEPLVIEERRVGGLLNEANLVENYPGFPEGISGTDLVALIRAQLSRLDVHVVEDKATSTNITDESFITRTAGGKEYTSPALIVATGTVPKKAVIPGAAAIEGSKLFYEVSSIETKLIQSSRITVLGGGDAAYDYAINLSRRGGRVTIISRSPPSCLKLLKDRAQGLGVEVLQGHVVKEFAETDNHVAVSCESGKGEGRHHHACDLVVVAHGREPRLDAFSPELMGRLSEANPPVTGVPGLFIAGDVARGTHRQATIAAGDGVLAAMMVQRFLEERGESA